MVMYNHAMVRFLEKMERYEIVYRLSSDGAMAGQSIEVRELADVMYSFADVVQASLDATGEDGRLDVHVRPFKEGSFITEFILTYSQPIINFFSSPEGAALATALTVLGFMKDTAGSLPNVIRKVRGRIDRFRKNEDGTVTYGDGDDIITVSEDAHKIIQSPDVAKSFKKTTIGPLLNIDKSITVNIVSRDEFLKGNFSEGDTFDRADIGDIETYEETAASEGPLEFEDIEQIAHNVVLNPISGSYSGSEKGYRFKAGDTRYDNVKLEDDCFREKLENGEIRLMSKDVLVVDMKCVQSISARSGNINRHWSIVEVKNYTPFQVPIQDRLEGLADQ